MVQVAPPLPPSRREPSVMLSRSISERRAASIISAAILGSAAAIELARVWFAGPHMLVVDQLLGVAAALLLSITATALVTNERETAPFLLLVTFALLAHGGTLAITLSPFGALYLTLAVVLVALAQVARGKATLGIGRTWKSARVAAPAASPNPHATLV